MTFDDNLVKNALIKDGWTITHDPYALTFLGGDRHMDTIDRYRHIIRTLISPVLVPRQLACNLPSFVTIPNLSLLGLQRLERQSFTLVLSGRRVVVLDVSVGKGYKYSLRSENLNSQREELCRAHMMISANSM
jgi:hypothetical protein